MNDDLGGGGGGGGGGLVEPVVRLDCWDRALRQGMGQGVGQQCWTTMLGQGAVNSREKRSRWALNTFFDGQRLDNLGSGD